MTIKLTSIPLLAAVLLLTVGCGKQEVPAANTADEPMAAATPAAPDSATSAPAAAVAVAPYTLADNVQAGGNCALDAINGGPAAGASVQVGSEVMFGGWIADASNQVPSDARLVLKGEQNTYSAPLVAGAERPDVAAALQAESLLNAGYNVLTRLDVEPGTYELSIVHGPEAAASSCPLNASLVVTG